MGWCFFVENLRIFLKIKECAKIHTKNESDHISSISIRCVIFIIPSNSLMKLFKFYANWINWRHIVCATKFSSHELARVWICAFFSFVVIAHTSMWIYKYRKFLSWVNWADYRLENCALTCMQRSFSFFSDIDDWFKWELGNFLSTWLDRKPNKHMKSFCWFLVFISFDVYLLLQKYIHTSSVFTFLYILPITHILRWIESDARCAMTQTK